MRKKKKRRRRRRRDSSNNKAGARARPGLSSKSRQWIKGDSKTTRRMKATPPASQSHHPGLDRLSHALNFIADRITE
jgi:hypothetical protein